MRAIVKNKFFSLSGKSTVKDENGNDIFQVKGKMISLRKRKALCDMEGNVLFRIRNKFLTFLFPKAYILDAENRKLGVVRRKLMSLRTIYYLEEFSDNISIEGNFIGWDLTVYRDGVDIGTIRRDLNLFVDAFVVDGNEADLPLLVAITIAIDNILDKASNDNR